MTEPPLSAAQSERVGRYHPLLLSRLKAVRESLSLTTEQEDAISDIFTDVLIDVVGRRSPEDHVTAAVTAAMDNQIGWVCGRGGRLRNQKRKLRVASFTAPGGRQRDCTDRYIDGGERPADTDEHPLEQFRGCPHAATVAAVYEALADGRAIDSVFRTSGERLRWHRKQKPEVAAWLQQHGYEDWNPTADPEHGGGR